MMRFETTGGAPGIVVGKTKRVTLMLQNAHAWIARNFHVLQQHTSCIGIFDDMLH